MGIEKYCIYHERLVPVFQSAGPRLRPTSVKSAIPRSFTHGHCAATTRHQHFDLKPWCHATLCAESIAQSSGGSSA